MRVRTAVVVVATFIVVKAAVTWVALNRWASYPEHATVHHRHVELGPVAEWLAAAAAAGAAIIALNIAGRDRKDRIRELHRQQKAQARLVQLIVETDSTAGVVVQVRNFGPLPVIDIDLVGATWSEHRDARWEPTTTHWIGRNRQATKTHRPILRPCEGLDDTFDTLAYFRFTFRSSPGTWCTTSSCDSST